MKCDGDCESLLLYLEGLTAAAIPVRIQRDPATGLGVIAEQRTRGGVTHYPIGVVGATVAALLARVEAAEAERDRLREQRKAAEETTVEVEWRGDPSVGLWGGSLTILDMPPTGDAKDREVVRKMLADAFDEILGEPVTVAWGDEIRASLEAESAFADAMDREEEMPHAE